MTEGTKTMPEILPHEIAEIALQAYEAKGFQVARVGTGGGRFATYQFRTPDGSQTFTVTVEEVW